MNSFSRITGIIGIILLTILSKGIEGKVIQVAVDLPIEQTSDLLYFEYRVIYVTNYLDVTSNLYVPRTISVPVPFTDSNTLPDHFSYRIPLVVNNGYFLYLIRACYIGDVCGQDAPVLFNKFDRIE